MTFDVFTDGGCAGRNPSALGGSWAWVQVAGGVEVRRASGTVTPAQVGLPVVTNNLTELLAAVEALEACPAGWAGTIHTDNKVTLHRVHPRPKPARPSMVGIPQALRDRLAAAKARLGRYAVRLVAGHPTGAELAAGRTAKGVLASPFNVACDILCGAESTKLKHAITTCATTP